MGSTKLYKHAYLIIAHKNPKQLNRLLRALDDKRNDIFILIDKKSVNLFKHDCDLKYSKLTWVKPVDIYWGDYSQIAAELRLFKAANLAEDNYSYYHLLSGMDLPLANQDEIHRFFDSNPGKEFLTYSAMVDQFSLNARLYKHHFTKTFRSNNPIYRFLHKVENKIISKKVRKQPVLSKIGFASNWVSLDNDLVSALVKEANQIERKYKGTFCCDEVFIPTFIQDHPEFLKKVYYSNKVHDRPEELQGNLRYINWWDGSPYVWRLKDYKILMAAKEKGYLFARKFDERVDNDIIVKLTESY